MAGEPILHTALTRCIERGLTFAAFRSPGQPVQLWAQRDPALETVDGTLLLGLNQVFLLAPFDLDAGQVPFIRSDIELMFAEIDPDISRLEQCEGEQQAVHELGPETTRQAFVQSVEEGADACRTGRLSKVVLSRVVHMPITRDQLPELFLQAIEADQNTFVAMAQAPGHGLWMGASPERLMHEHLDHVRVDALAATRPADGIPERISGWGAKELDEQEQVMTHVHSTFARMDLQNIVVRGPEVLVAGPVAHLHTLLEADLGNCLLGELVLALHPTPAVCGSPVNAAKKAIARWERHPRGLYTGFWGPWNADGPTELYVNLRCLQAGPGRALLYVGAGITAGSDPEQEWTETERKAATWLRLLPAASGAI